jgi:hypothetical protein
VREFHYAASGDYPRCSVPGSGSFSVALDRLVDVCQVFNEGLSVSFSLHAPALGPREVSYAMSQPTPDLPPPERRAWVRHPCNLDTPHSIIDAVTECGWWAAVVNVSRSGIALRVPQLIGPGSTLVVEAPSGHSWARHALPVRVVRATAIDGGRWLLGCQFVYPLSDEDVEAMLQPAEPRTAGCTRPARFQSFGMPAGTEV